MIKLEKFFTFTSYASAFEIGETLVKRKATAIAQYAVKNAPKYFLKMEIDALSKKIFGSAADAAIKKNVFGPGMTALIILNEEIDDGLFNDNS